MWIFKRLFLLPAIILLIIACARVSSPSGGPRDRQPPVVIKSIPDWGAKNFSEKNIVITFDEYVVLDNINEKFMVSPPMDKKPNVFIKNKNVNVEFEDELRDSTTYTFYFMDAIKDLNEGNIIDNYQFVFSTGPVIDSLSVTGNVYSSFYLEPPEKTLVLMYGELADSAVIKQLPDYITRVDEKGDFRFNNVRSGIYRLYALKDIDNSKNFNLTEEEFAFLDSPVEITPEKNFIPVVEDTTAFSKDLNEVPEHEADTMAVKSEYQLILFSAPKTEHYLTGSSRDLKYQLLYTLSLPPDSMQVDFSIPGAGDNTYYTEKSRERDTLKIWLTDSTLYSQEQITTILKYPFTDTIGMLGYKEDTILMRFLTPRARRGVVVKKPPFTFNANISNRSLKPGQQIVFESQTPFRQPDTTRIMLYEILDTNRINIPYSFTKDSTNSCKYFFNADLLPGKEYLFISDSASFGNLYNECSDSTGIGFTVREPDSYSKLTLNIQNYEGDRIIQLLDKTEKLVHEVYMKEDGPLVFPMLEVGFYRIRVIYDLNNDRKWTTGDFSSGIQPEPVSYFLKGLEIKRGWEHEEDWDIKVKNVKNRKLK